MRNARDVIKLTNAPRLVVKGAEEPGVAEDEPTEGKKAQEVEGLDVVVGSAGAEEPTHVCESREAHEKHLQAVEPS